VIKAQHENPYQNSQNWRKSSIVVMEGPNY